MRGFALKSPESAKNFCHEIRIAPQIGNLVSREQFNDKLKNHRKPLLSRAQAIARLSSKLSADLSMTWNRDSHAQVKSCAALLSAHKRPPCDSMIDRLMRSPMPVPCV